jgi:hypothetical protein
MATQISGDLYVKLDGKLVEIKRQMRQPGGYPFDPEKLNGFLQRAVEGRFDDNQRWREQDGVIYFKVTSNGMTGPQWIEHFEEKGIRLSKWANCVLNSRDFKPTNGVTTEVAVLKGVLFEDNYRVTWNIRAEADKRKLARTEAELGCLIRDMFSDEEIEAMGLKWIVAFHEPIKNFGDDLTLFCAGRGGGGHWLSAYGDMPAYGWDRDSGFAFAVSQVSS